jgi:hypothetical protein
MTGAEVRAEIEALKDDKEKGGFIGYGEKHQWTHKSGLTRLPYFNDLLLPHNIDVMHTEKNITEVLFATLMDIPNKSKDNIKARLDLAMMYDRPKQVMKPPAPGMKWRRTPVNFVLKKDSRQCHGEDFDPATQPLDIDLLMRLGGGKQHGQYWMVDNTVDSASVPNLAEIRARSTSSSLPIRSRQQSSQQQMVELQVSTILFVIHCFYTSTLPLYYLNIVGGMLQADLRRLESQHAAQAEAHQLEMEVVQA